MLFQLGEVDLGNILTPFLSIGVLLVLILFMGYCYMKLRNFAIYTVVFIFSIIFGVSSLELKYLPFTPYLQIFFILIQTTLYLIMTIEMIEK